MLATVAIIRGLDPDFTVRTGGTPTCAIKGASRGQEMGKWEPGFYHHHDTCIYARRVRWNEIGEKYVREKYAQVRRKKTK